MRPALPWYQNQTRTKQRRQLEANVFDKHRCKNSQQNSSELNATVLWKGYAPSSRGAYSKGTSVSQRSQINQCDTPHKQKDQIIRVSQQMQEEHLTRFNIHLWFLKLSVKWIKVINNLHVKSSWHLPEQWKTKRVLLDQKQVYALSPFLLTTVLEELLLLKFFHITKNNLQLQCNSYQNFNNVFHRSGM